MEAFESGLHQGKPIKRMATKENFHKCRSHFFNFRAIMWRFGRDVALIMDNLNNRKMKRKRHLRLIASLATVTINLLSNIQFHVLMDLAIKIFSLTRGPTGHILDTAIRCFRAIRVQLPN